MSVAPASAQKADARRREVALDQQAEKDFHYRRSNTMPVKFSPNMGSMIKWDLIMCVVLIYTAFATPYELAFLEIKIDSMFVVNRICDLTFLVDIYGSSSMLQLFFQSSIVAEALTFCTFSEFQSGIHK